jgi:hypothetical protein
VPLSSVDVATVIDIYYCHDPVLVVDPVDDPVSTAPRAEPVVHQRKKPLPNLQGSLDRGPVMNS